MRVSANFKQGRAPSRLHACASLLVVPLLFLMHLWSETQHGFENSWNVGIEVFPLSSSGNTDLLLPYEFLLYSPISRFLQQLYTDIDLHRAALVASSNDRMRMQYVYVPIYSGLLYHLCSDPAHGQLTIEEVQKAGLVCVTLNELVEQVTSSQLWRSTQGKNFIWPHAHAFAYHTLSHENYRAVSQGILFSVEPTHFLAHANASARYCIIPYAVVEPQSLVMDESGFGFNIDSVRLHKVCFGGRNQTRIRADMLNAMSSQEDGSHIITATDHQLYMRELMTCDFCLIPDGDVASTGRLFESLVAGCIPVIKSPELLLPFTRIVNWTEISLRYDGHTPAVEILKHLRDLSVQDVRDFRKRIADIKPSHMFAFQNPLTLPVKHASRHRTLGDYLFEDCLQQF